MRKASFYSWMFFLIGVASFVNSTISQTCFGIMGQRLARDLRMLLFSSILNQEVGWFDREENNSGQLSARLATGESALQILTLVHCSLTSLR